jgi:hypothetical protein
MNRTCRIITLGALLLLNLSTVACEVDDATDGAETGDGASRVVSHQRQPQTLGAAPHDRYWILYSLRESDELETKVAYGTDKLLLTAGETHCYEASTDRLLSRVSLRAQEELELGAVIYEGAKESIQIALQHDGVAEPALAEDDWNEFNNLFERDVDPENAADLGSYRMCLRNAGTAPVRYGVYYAREYENPAAHGQHGTAASPRTRH